MFLTVTVAQQYTKTHCYVSIATIVKLERCNFTLYEGWNFNSGNYLFTTDTK